MSDPTPLSPEEFDAAMAAVAPFETCPHLAVAVSGGADSMTLCLLANRWVQARGGCVTALTVDHGLRTESNAEARQVTRWLKRLQIEHKLLRWRGEKPTAGVQQAARSARFRLMCQWCREAGVLHLLLGHHEQDQAETVLMRYFRDSGIDGLAGMASVAETFAVRLVRPLLKTSPLRLRATLSAYGQEWIEDPSNSNPAYTRNRIRSILPRLAESGVSVPLVVTAGDRMAGARTALENAASTLLARCCRLYPAGYARLDERDLTCAPDPVSTRSLARLLTTIGGRTRPPPAEKLERVFSKLMRERSTGAATLGGCRLMRTNDGILVCREARELPCPQLAATHGPILWDGRFVIDFVSSVDAPTNDFRLIPLGVVGSRQVGGAGNGSGRHSSALPLPVRITLPALADRDEIVSVPHLRYQCPDAESVPVRFRAIAFRPQAAVSGAGRFLA